MSARLPVLLGLLLASGCGGCRHDVIERTTSFATVRGTLQEGVEAYRGIRYGAAPAGRARWEEAAAPSYADVVDATAWGPECAQRNVYGRYAGEDDCLVVNVWTPEGARVDDARPVLAFVHGGGNVFGSSSEAPPASDPAYDGTVIAAEQGVVVVTFNYRLGPFGFAALEGVPGNLGLRDQQAALRWVQEHIADFGGDPTHVLLFGESGGGQDVCALMASPRSAGLFSFAIVQSGSCLQPGPEHRRRGLDEVLATLGCTDLACLAEQTTRDIALALPREEGTSWMAPGLNAWGPWTDGEVLLDSPHRVLADAAVARVPFVLGTNDEEHVLFPSPVADCAEYAQFVRDELVGLEPDPEEVLVRYPCADDEHVWESWGALIDDVRFHCPARLATAGAAPHGPVWRYVLDRGRDRGLFAGQGAFHGVELGFLFGTHNNPSGEEAAFGRDLRRIWAELARTGAPPADLGWPLYDEGRQVLRLNDTHRVDAAYREEACAFWDDTLPLR